MAAAIELIIIPVLLIMTVIVAGIWGDSPVAAMLFGSFVILAVINVVRYARRLDMDDHIDEAPNYHGPEDEPPPAPVT
jgi:hypothetical protein